MFMFEQRGDQFFGGHFDTFVVSASTIDLPENVAGIFVDVESQSGPTLFVRVLLRRRVHPQAPNVRAAI